MDAAREIWALLFFVSLRACFLPNVDDDKSKGLFLKTFAVAA
jgi:hypothetical protein